MKIFLAIFLLITEIQPVHSQDSIRIAITKICRTADSIIQNINNADLVERKIMGSVEPLSNVSGLAFLDMDHKEIRKLQLTSLFTYEVLTYYCFNNEIRVITSSRAIYYRNKNEWYVAHAIGEEGLLTRKQLQAQEEFFRAAMVTSIKGK